MPVAGVGATRMSRHGALGVSLRGMLAPPLLDIPIGKPYQQPFDKAYDRELKKQELKFLEDCFRRVDVDGSGEVTCDEFSACMSNPETFRIFNRRFGLQKHETPRVFRALDADGSGAVSIGEWLTTCRLLMNIVSEGDVITSWKVRDIKEKLASLQASKSGNSNSNSARAGYGVGADNGVRCRTRIITPRTCFRGVTPRREVGQTARELPSALLWTGTPRLQKPQGPSIVPFETSIVTPSSQDRSDRIAWSA
eukprot:TRINITY_DN63031_c0_g1_i1.p1 TRINITY_DN63031_c0_g1~~TRINITY_DN63031_c0_g1_i1.p1  ORF type:complete len:269 (-),score=37.15 TRINITY_DN63031_c0_g1_i1:258-1013(-)